MVTLRDGRWAAFEVKMGTSQIEAAASNLRALAERAAPSGGGPTFLMVLTAGQPAYRRPDGVFVVPLACLAP